MNATRNSDEQNARIEHDKVLGRVITDLLNDDTTLYQQYTENEDFKRWMADAVFRIAYRQAGRP